MLSMWSKKETLKDKIDYEQSSLSIINPDYSTSLETNILGIYKLDQPLLINGITKPGANKSRIICIESGSHETRCITFYLLNIIKNLNTRLNPIMPDPWKIMTFDSKNLDKIASVIEDVRRCATEFKEAQISNEQVVAFKKEFGNHMIPTLEGDTCEYEINKTLQIIGESTEFESHPTTCVIC